MDVTGFPPARNVADPMSNPLAKDRSDAAFQPIMLRSAGLEASILPYGATLARLSFAEGRNLVLGLKESRDYCGHGFSCGPIVGPMANRLADGQVRLDGRLHQMPRNEGGKTTLHSGPEGIQFRAWTVLRRDETSVTLSCHLDHGACGLPGFRQIDATYTLDASALTLHLRARSDRTTLMNLAHHPYWAVTDEAQLRIQSSHVLPVTEQKIPTGRLADVHGTDFDLTKARPIPKHLDHNFVLSHETCDTPRPVAWLETPDYRLSLETTAPGLQVYAGGGLPHLPAETCDGARIGPYAGLALEPQLWPDAPNHVTFPTATLLTHNQWSQITIYRLEK